MKNSEITIGNILDIKRITFWAKDKKGNNYRYYHYVRFFHRDHGCCYFKRYSITSDKRLEVTTDKNYATKFYFNDGDKNNFYDLVDYIENYARPKIPLQIIFTKEIISYYGRFT